MANKHTSGAGIVFIGCFAFTKIGSIWFPEHKQQFEDTLGAVKDMAVTYGFIMAGDGKTPGGDAKDGSDQRDANDSSNQNQKPNDTMKKSLLGFPKFKFAAIALAVIGLIALFLPAKSHGQEATNAPVAPTPPVSITDWLSSGLSAFNNSTNTIYDVHGIYAPALSKKAGFGIGLAVPVTELLYTHFRLDDVGGQFYAVSANVGIQKTLNLPLGLHLTPEVHAGVGIPMAGTHIGTFTIPGSVTDGQPQAITGGGLLARVYTWSTGFVDVYGTIETWSPMSAKPIYLFGVMGHIKF